MCSSTNNIATYFFGYLVDILLKILFLCKFAVFVLALKIPNYTFRARLQGLIHKCFTKLVFAHSIID